MGLDPEKVRRILVIRTDRFGEFILNTPVIRALKHRFPKAYLCVMAAPVSRELIEGVSLVDEVMVYDEGSQRGFFGGLRLAAALRKQKFDLVLILNPKKEFNIITFLAGIPLRVGYDRKWGFLLTRRIRDKKSCGIRHEVECNLDLARSIGADTRDRSLFVYLGKEDLNSVDSLLRQQGVEKAKAIVAIHPWTSDPIKQWPLEKFLDLSSRLLKDNSCKVVIIGGKEEAGQGEDFSRQVPGLVNLTGRLTLRQSAALLKKCRLLISNDSGPVHLSSAVGTPVIAIFRNDIPGKSAKRWGPWGQGHAVIEGADITKISVEDVFFIARNKLI
ncbi:MAG: glycosyltransferase family 9 protein [Candidatus Omnitrophica bacterium]|nr:glycosyltransferase family 9 protein [Candidatus Omnitrophota bacterium]